MRKRIVSAVSVRSALQPEHWLDLEGLAVIEASSEDPAHPLEAALLPGHGDGWRASEPGVQVIRILFDNPQDIVLIHLVFIEEHTARTQEFCLRWSTDPGQPPQELLRQQYNFSPISSEVEDYTVNLAGVRVLELELNPAISDRQQLASLAELRLR